MTSQPPKPPRAVAIRAIAPCIAVLVAAFGVGCGQDAPDSQRSVIAAGPDRVNYVGWEPDAAEAANRNPRSNATDPTRHVSRGVRQGDVRNIALRRATRQAAGVKRPPIIHKFIPFAARRKRETAAYARRHYGHGGYRLVDPHVIVEHFTVNSSVQATYNAFAPDVADVELHELPGVCSHYVVARNGSIYQFVPLGIMCRHTVGLNYAAVGIEHVGYSDREILGNARQLRASLRLTAWLRCRLDIKLKDVIGHNESLSSPYHHENVPRLRSQTHGDWKRANMQVYRRKLRRLNCG